MLAMAVAPNSPKIGTVARLDRVMASRDWEMSFRPGPLHYFVTVAEEGQITRAARRLHIAQPALSQAIAQLEAELGLKLLDRHPRGVTLTPAGEQFFVKASLAVDATRDAMQTARSLARAQRGTIEFGFLGAPPGLDSPAPLALFASTHPSIDIRYRDLPFPFVPTASWLADVDMAVCHRPPEDPNVWAQLLRVEPRVVLAPKTHPLAERLEVSVADVIDETFISLHPSVEPAWAGFWSLDDHRGSPPSRLTADRAANPQEVLASLSVRTAITTVPTSVAGVIANILPSVAVVSLLDADPSSIMLVGHEDRSNVSVAAFATFARMLMETGGSGLPTLDGATARRREQPL
jgi:DNA-binding transcriptional LysR family regulator